MWHYPWLDLERSANNLCTVVEIKKGVIMPCFRSPCTHCGRRCAAGQSSRRSLPGIQTVCLRCASRLAMDGKWNPPEGIALLWCEHEGPPFILERTMAELDVENFFVALRAINRLASMDECTRAVFYANQQRQFRTKRFQNWASAKGCYKATKPRRQLKKEVQKRVCRDSVPLPLKRKVLSPLKKDRSINSRARVRKVP